MSGTLSSSRRDTTPGKSDGASGKLATMCANSCFASAATPEVAGSSEEMIARAEQIQWSDFVAVASQYAFGGQAPDAERK